MWERTFSLHISLPSSTCLRFPFKIHVLLPALIPSEVEQDSPAQQVERMHTGVWRAQLQHLQKQFSLGVSTKEKQEKGAGAAFGKGNPKTHNYCTAMIALGYVTSQSIPMRGQHRATNTWRGGFSNGRVQSLQQHSSAPASSLYALLNIIINIWRKKKEK